MKLNKIAIAVGAAVMGLSSIASAELSANIGATSNYLWRGVTQTDDGPAVSGGIDYTHASGFYAGVWTSNVDFVDASGNQAELDLYGGFSGESGSLGYDLGLIYYAYPMADKPDDKLDFTEIYGSLSFGPVTGGIAYTIDTEAGGDDDNWYFHANAGTDLQQGWGIGGTVGYFDFDGCGSDCDYWHAQIDVTKSAGDFGDFTFTLSKNFGDDDTWDDDVIPVVSWAKSFE